MSNFRHGLRYTRSYKAWAHAKDRCCNKNNKGYLNYGGRGIKMYDEWVNNSELYISYINSLPNAGLKGYTIDRIDNDKGYIPGNLRWATKTEQVLNQRPKKSNTSGYIGVGYKPDRGKWSARVMVNYKSKTIGYFRTKELAALARNIYIKQNNLPYKMQNITI